MDYQIQEQHKSAFAGLVHDIDALYAEKGRDKITQGDFADVLVRLRRAIGGHEMAVFLKHFNAHVTSDLQVPLCHL